LYGLNKQFEGGFKMEKKDGVEEAKRLEKLRREMEEFEEGFPDGVYTAPSSPNEPRIKLKEMYQFCREKGIDPEDLTEEELEQFLVYPEQDEKTSQ
jgi:Ribonuclease G/E